MSASSRKKSPVRLKAPRKEAETSGLIVQGQNVLWRTSPPKKTTTKESETPAPLTRAVVAVVSDLHVGSTVGLCPPDGIELEDGGRYTPNAFQVWMWAQWAEYWELVKQTAGDWPVVVIVNGEFIEGNHHRSTQITTPSPSVMIPAAEQVLEPALRISSKSFKLYVTKGTAAHVGEGGANDVLVAKALNAEKDAESGQHAFYHLRVVIGGVYFDVAHHISNTMRAWTHGNNIRTEVLEIMDDARSSGDRLPDYIIRSHVHKFADTGLNYPVRGIITPAWQGLTEYTHRLTRRVNRTVGGLIIPCENGVSQFTAQSVFQRTLPGSDPLIA